MNTLSAAVKLFLDHQVSTGNVCGWSKTLNVTPEQFRAEVERQQSERSLKPSNDFESEGK
jgi:hypothetical protein